MNQFVENTFPSISSLDTLDSLLLDLESTRHDLTKKAREIADFEHEIQQRASSVIKHLEELTKNKDTQAAIEILDEMIENEGPVTVFFNVRETLVEINKLQACNRLRNELRSFQSEMNHWNTCLEDLSWDTADFDDVLAMMQRWHASIQSFGDQPTADAETLKEVSGKVQENFSRIHCFFVKTHFLERLNKLLEGADIDSDGDRFKAAETVLNQVLNLQYLDFVNRNLTYPKTLWAMDAFIHHAFTVRFKYHFHINSSKETNRLDKPEWCLQFVEKNIGELLEKASVQRFLRLCRQHDFYKRYFSINVIISSILNPVREKFQNDVEIVCKEDKLLAHTIIELQKNDNHLMQKFHFNPLIDSHSADSTATWQGLTKDIILDSPELFSLWIANERKFANLRLEEIINLPNAFAIEYESVPADEDYKPTKSSTLLSTLYENMTEIYKDLQSLKHQNEFLSIQLNLLTRYYDTLNEGLSAWRSAYLKKKLINNTVIDDVNVDPIERLFRIYCSLNHTILCMSMWGENALFLKLWKFIHQNETSLKTTFFESLIRLYRSLSEKCLEALIEFFRTRINHSMKPLFEFNSWHNMHSVISPASRLEVVKAAESLKPRLVLMEKYLTNRDKLATLAKASQLMAEYVEDNIIKANKFSRQGGQQLYQDVQHLWTTSGLLKTNPFYTLQESCAVLNRSEVQKKFLTERDVGVLMQRRL